MNKNKLLFILLIIVSGCSSYEEVKVIPEQFRGSWLGGSEDGESHNLFITENTINWTYKYEDGDENKEFIHPIHMDFNQKKLKIVIEKQHWLEITLSKNRSLFVREMLTTYGEPEALRTFIIYPAN